MEWPLAGAQPQSCPSEPRVQTLISTMDRGATSVPTQQFRCQGCHLADLILGETQLTTLAPELDHLQNLSSLDELVSVHCVVRQATFGQKAFHSQFHIKAFVLNSIYWVKDLSFNWKSGEIKGAIRFTQ